MQNIVFQGLPQYLTGARWRDHRASVEAILGAQAPPVESYGDSFYNIDRWVGGKFLIHELGKRGKGALALEIRKAIHRANSIPSPPRKIVVAETPDNLPLSTLQALIGGCYHEAWHTLYSHRESITSREEDWLVEKLEPLLGQLPTKKKTYEIWGHLWNLLEDIRIERRGCQEFVGTPPNMRMLHDFVLDQEDAGRKKHNLPIQPNSVLLGGFSLLGLGYDTPKSNMRLLEYQQAYPDVWELLEKGEIADILRETKAMTSNKLEALVLSLRLLVAIQQAGHGSGEGDEEGDEEGKGKGKGKGVRIFIKNLQDVLDGKTPELEDCDGNPVKIEDLPDLGILSSGEALGQAIRAAWKPKDLRKGEEPWHPYSTQGDEFKPVAATRGSVKPDLLRLRRQSNTLRLRLATLFKMRQQVQEIHGLPEGSELSEDLMVASYVELRHGVVPTRPWKDVTDRMEVTIDAVTVLDQSGSMGNQVHVLRDTALMLNDALAGLHAKTFILGFESGNHGYPVSEYDAVRGYHRATSTNFNIFKTWEMPWEKAQNNLTNINISGGTPMSDGIQLGLSLLRKRKSRFRFLFIVTDGHPDQSHQKVVNRQLRLASEAGFFAVGIGIGADAKYVQQLFPHHVWVDQIDGLANACAFKLAQLLEPHITLWDTSVFQYGAGKR
jgi:uncharacterized protein YegL